MKNLDKKNQKIRGFTPLHRDCSVFNRGSNPLKIQKKSNLVFFSGKACARGFTMIEAVFAIFIIGSTLMTFFAVMAAMMRSEMDARDTIVATNLAQEGIEMARNYRDNNWKNGELAFCNDSDNSKNPCSNVDVTGNFPLNKSCAPSASCYNDIDPATSPFPVYDDDLRNKFERKILITGNDGTKKIVTSTVTIKRTGKTVIITDTLYPWADAE